MSLDGAIMDAVATRLEAVVTGITTERGLSNPSDQSNLPYAYLYNPSLDVTRLEYQQSEETVGFTVLIILAGTQEAMLAALDAFKADLASDPYVGQSAALTAQGVRGVTYESHAIAESPDSARVMAGVEIQAVRVTS